MQKYKHLRIVISLIFIVLLAFALFSQRASLPPALDALKSAHVGLVVAAVVASFATYVFAALNYRILALKPVRYARVLLIQLAALAVNRVLPSGAGALGVNFVYLRKQQHTNAQAATVISINNLLGLISTCLLVICAAAVSGVTIPVPSGSALPIILIMLVSFVAVYLLRKRLQPQLRQIKVSLQTYANRPTRIGLALCSALLLSLSNALALYFCTLAVGLDVSFFEAFIAISIGVGVGAAVPTPGGLGGVEAGTIVALVSFGATKESAFAAVIIFRLITFWLALAIGSVVFLYVQRKKYL